MLKVIVTHVLAPQPNVEPHQKRERDRSDGEMSNGKPSEKILSARRLQQFSQSKRPTVNGKHQVISFNFAVDISVERAQTFGISKRRCGHLQRPSISETNYAVAPASGSSQTAVAHRVIRLDAPSESDCC